jgi:2,3-bisphosphoglycerate-dependent phosphoglycerate mutase
MNRLLQCKHTLLVGFLCVLLSGILGGTPAVAGEKVLHIYLARHGQTSWNAEKRLQGWTDTVLNETGEEQAKSLGRLIRGIPIRRIYCSTLARSQRTAEIVSAGKIPITRMPELREQSFGKFAGKYLDGRDPAIIEEYERRSADPKDSLDGGESLDQLYARVKTGLDKILQQQTKGAILIVGHGGTNTQILRALLNLSAEQSQKIDQANDELYLIEVVNRKAKRLWKYMTPDRLEEL